MKLWRLLVLVVVATMPRAAFAVTISNATELAAAISSATGGEVFDLAPGDYGTLSLSTRQFSTSITIRSANPAQPAVFGQSNLTNVSGVNFTSVTFSSTLSSGQAAWTPAVNIRNSANITFSKVDVHGSLDNNTANDGYGINALNSSNITISNSNFSQLYRAVVIGGTQNIQITGNTIQDIRSDGLNFGQVQNLSIVGNSISNFHPLTGDHPDAIQIWTAGTTQASANILVSGNLIASTAGTQIQGIFITGGDGVLRYQGVTIVNNTLVGTSWHGITLIGADGVAVTGNTVVTLPGGTVTESRITLNDVVGILKNNSALKFSILNSPGVTASNNVVNAASTALAAAVIQAWSATHKLPLPTLGVTGPSIEPVKNIPSTTPFTIPTPTPESPLPPANDLFPEDPLKTASLPPPTGTPFDEANDLQQNLADNAPPVSGDLASAAPEPAIWLQLIAGFGAVGWLMRRQRKAMALA